MGRLLPVTSPPTDLGGLWELVAVDWWQWTHPSAVDADVSQLQGTLLVPPSPQSISPDRSPSHLSP